MSFDEYQAFGSRDVMRGPFSTGRHETFIGVPGAYEHGHVVWHDGVYGPVYDFVRDAQGNFYANGPTSQTQFIEFLGRTGLR